MYFTYCVYQGEVGNVNFVRTHCCLNIIWVLLLRRKRRMDIRQITSCVCHWPFISLFPFILVFSVLTYYPLATPWMFCNLNNFLLWFCTSFSLFHKSTSSSFVLSLQSFSLHWFLNNPRVLHIFNFIQFWTVHTIYFFSQNAVQFCSMTLQSLTSFNFPHLMRMLSGSLIFCDLENINPVIWCVAFSSK